jgi:aryl-alcohol dehydrogenase-like predicted oxidoreductase
LGVERHDLFQLHSWGTEGIQALDWLETLNALRLEGKVDQIGVSLRDFRPDEGVALAELGLVSSEQVIFNVFEQRPVERLLPAAARTGTAIIARVPLDSGSLTGTWDEGTYATWEPGSQPHQMFRGERFAETLGRMQALKALCAPYYPTLAEAAMRYVLSRPEVSVVIPGMRTPAEVDMNVTISDGGAFPGELAATPPAHGWIRDYYH